MLYCIEFLCFNLSNSSKRCLIQQRLVYLIEHCFLHFWSMLEKIPNKLNAGIQAYPKQNHLKCYYNI